jgi:hypothetical protein
MRELTCIHFKQAREPMQTKTLRKCVRVCVCVCVCVCVRKRVHECLTLPIISLAPPANTDPKFVSVSEDVIMVGTHLCRVRRVRRVREVIRVLSFKRVRRARGVTRATRVRRNRYAYLK